MKVLILGWEFPPHISGGLGTACAGLTQALEKQGVHVLFVVPKLHGGEKADKATFINASTVPFTHGRSIRKDDSIITSAGTHAQEMDAQSYRGETKRKRSVVEVESFLKPYTDALEPMVSPDLESWNYSFQEQYHRTLPANLRSRPNDRGTQEAITRRTKEPYAFSGRYGSNLLEEVERYGEVVAEIARRNSFDVIHAHDWMTFKAGLAAKKVSGKPLIVHVHATEADRSGINVNPRIFEIEREGMLQADRVVTVSQWTKDIVSQQYQVAPEKVEVIHNGISPKENGVPKSSAPPIGSQIVTFLGRITHQKGPMYFVEAARRVHEQFPDIHFVVAGSGDQLPLMIERIAQLRLSSYFHFTGFLRGEDIDRVWAISSVYVMPSVSEPFGIAPLEAIQAGVPVIISKQAGVSEVMAHAIKVDFWNSDALAEAICNVLRFKSLANTLKKNSADAIKNITWDKAAKKLIQQYYELTFTHEKRKKPGFVLPGSSANKTSQPAVL